MVKSKKIKVLLVRPKFSSIMANLEPLGLEYIAGLCRDLNIECEIFDEFQYSHQFRFNRLARKISKGGYNFVGFHVNANTTDYVIETAAKLKKKFSNLYLMIGGPEAELNYEDFFTESIDFIYHDNGLTSLKNAFLGNFTPEVLKKQNGICFKVKNKWISKEKGEPVNDFITTPDRTAFRKGFKKNFIFLKGKFAIAKASFSCPFACTFCYCAKMNSGVYTERAIKDVVDEIEKIDHNKIWFVDDTFFIDKERVELFCNEVIKRKIDKQFMAYSRADFLAQNSDILPLVYKAGFRDVLVGLEAVNDEFLEDYNKQTSKDVNIKAVKNLRDNNIVCNGLFVVSHRSTKQDFKDIMRFIKDNKLLWVVFGIFTPYKGTDAYEEYKECLVKFKAKRLDGIHITVKPEQMFSFMFMVRVYLLYGLTYPKIYWRTLFKTAYDTKKTGWF